MCWKTAILTVSSRGTRDETESTCALVIRELIEEELNGEIVDDRVVPNELDEVMAALIEMCGYYRADLILTTGGAGPRPEDVVPEATRNVIQRELPGFPELIRANKRAQGRNAAAFRGTAGLNDRTLIINLPDTPKGVSEAMLFIMKDMEDVLRALHGEGRETGR